MSRLQGKRAVITGGTSGIGLASAQRFLAEGARVLITGRNQSGVDEAVVQLGEGARGCVVEVTKSQDLAKLAEAAKGWLGEIDAVLVNAGLGHFGPLLEIDEAAYGKQFDANVKGAFFTAKHLVPLMARGSSLVFVASSVHEKGAPGGSIYFASKAAVRSLTRSLATELGSEGIRVNSLSPGIVRTKFSQKTNLSEEEFEGFIDMVLKAAPLGREGTVDDMAQAALFLVSDDSTYMTAADLVVDGGYMNV